MILLAIATIFFNGLLLWVALVTLNNVIICLFDIVMFSKHQNFNLDSYIYSVTIVTFVDALYYNYNKVKKPYI